MRSESVTDSLSNREDSVLSEGEDSIEPGQYGFKGRIFPLLGFVVGVIAVFGSYYVAIKKSPPDVKPFPKTDITHTGIKFP